MKRITPAAISAALLSLAVGSASAQWAVTPYVWTAGIDAKVSLNGTQVLNQHIGFTELVDDVNLAAMVRVEGQFGRVGTMLDLFYIGMSTPAQSVTLPAGTAGLISSDIGMTIVDVTGSYGLGGSLRGLSLFAGTRVLAEGSTVDLTVPTSPTTSVTQSQSRNDWQVNAIVGLRFRRPLLPHLSMDARGDIGTGGTELTWSAGSEMVYGFGASQRSALRFGYRRLTIQYREETPVQANLTMAGFVAGFRFAF